MEVEAELDDEVWDMVVEVEVGVLVLVPVNEVVGERDMSGQQFRDGQVSPPGYR